MVKRRLDDWISSYLEYTEYSESPISYHTWAAVSAVASALQRKTHFQWADTTIYPNLYVILVGPSGHARKGEPVNNIRGILDDLGIKVVEEDITEEALIREIKLSENFFDRNSKGGTFDKVAQSPVTICAEELSVFCGQQNTRVLAYLTNWYDSRNKWGRRTKGSTVEEIAGICINMLASTAPDWFPYIFTHEAVGGGFTSRCVFVVEERKRKSVSNPNLFPPRPGFKEDLMHDLEIISGMVGEYRFTPEALEAYEKWYLEQDEIAMSGKLILGEPVLQSYESRRATLIKKICMILCASYKNSYEVELEDFQRALTLLTVTEEKMPAVFRGYGRSKYAEDTEAILSYIIRQGPVRKSDLVKAFYRNVDDQAFESILSVLVQMKTVGMKILTGDADREYWYKGESTSEP